MGPRRWILILFASVAMVVPAPFPFPKSIPVLADTSPDGGIVITDFGYLVQAFGSAVAIQPDGKIVEAGRAVLHRHKDYDLALARYMTSGSLDPSFGEGGKVTTDFGRDEYASALAIQSDGKIVVAGSTGNDSGDVADFALARYTTTGSLDPAFGEAGRVRTHFHRGSGASDVAIQSDGKIVVLGDSGGDVTLARYMPTGSLDPSFGHQGMLTTDLGSREDHGSAVATPSDGMIVVAGWTVRHQQTDFVLAGYTPAGSLDRSFGQEGKTITDFGSIWNAAADVAMQPDGKIVVTGSVGAYDSPEVGRFGLARYTAAGSLDPSFGTNGKVTTTFADYGAGEVVGSAVAIQPDGNIVVAGEKRIGAFALVRYTSTGSLDRNFGKGGKVTNDQSPGLDFSDVAIQPDGKIVVAGGSDDFFLARYTAMGSLDQTFGSEPASPSPSAFPSASEGARNAAGGREVRPGNGTLLFGAFVGFALLVVVAGLILVVIRRRKASSSTG